MLCHKTSIHTDDNYFGKNAVQDSIFPNNKDYRNVSGLQNAIFKALIHDEKGKKAVLKLVTSMGFLG